LTVLHGYPGAVGFIPDDLYIDAVEVVGIMVDILYLSSQSDAISRNISAGL
jgi:hypothetical protein